MTREEAIKIIESNCSCTDSKLREACAMFIPELAMSEYEKIIQELIDYFNPDIPFKTVDIDTANKWVAWLEKQKEKSEKPIIPEKENKVMEAIEGTIRVYGKTQGEWIAGYDMDTLVVHLRKAFAALEKQKESLHITETCKENANSFTDDIIEVRSFQRGLEEGIKQEREKRKEQKPADDEAKAIAYREYERGRESGLRDGQKYVLDNAESYGLCKPAEYLDKDKVYAIMKKLHDLSFSELIPINSDEFKKINEIVSDVCDLLDYPIEQKPAEWSEEDEHNLNSVISLVHNTSDGAWGSCIGDRIENWLKSLRPQPNTPSIKDTIKFGNLEYERGVKDGIQSEKSRQWKPSEEQMRYLLAVINEPNNIGAESCYMTIKSLYNDLQKLL